MPITTGICAAHVPLRFLKVIQQRVYFPTSGSSRPRLFLSGFLSPFTFFSFFPTPSPRVQVVIRAMAAYQPIPKAREKSEATEEIKGRGVRNAVNVIV